MLMGLLCLCIVLEVILVDYLKNKKTREERRKKQQYLKYLELQYKQERINTMKKYGRDIMGQKLTRQ